MAAYSPKVELQIKSDADGITVRSRRTKAAAKEYKDSAAQPFYDGYAGYCQRFGESSINSKKIKKRALASPTRLDAVPWWTTMTAQVVDMIAEAGFPKDRELQVELSQCSDIFLCQVYELLKPGKLLLASPLLDVTMHRLLEPLTVQNYMRFILGNPRSPTKVDKEQVEHFLGAHTIVLRLEISDLSTTSRQKDLRIGLMLKPLGGPTFKRNRKLGEYSYREQILSLPSAANMKKKIKLLVSSRRVREALPILGKTWALNKPSRILLLAPSGAGKEVLKDFIVAGLRPYIQEEGRVEEISLIGLDPQECHRQLFGDGDAMSAVTGALPLAQRINHINDLNEDPKPGIVFIDEIHQADPTTRASLLRVLEARKYFLPGAGHTVECKELYFVFAASCPLDSLRTLEPPDFWNRMDFIIQMEHPLDLEESERIRAVCNYLDMFLGIALNDLAQRATSSGPIGAKLTSLLKKGFRTSEREIKKVSDELSLQIAYLRPGLISIRHLRTLAQLMASLIVEHVFVIGEYRQSAIREAIKEWAKSNRWRSIVFGRLGEIIASQ